jgi:hypothetical protein
MVPVPQPGKRTTSALRPCGFRITLDRSMEVSDDVGDAA